MAIFFNPFPSSQPNSALSNWKLGDIWVSQNGGPVQLTFNAVTGKNSWTKYTKTPIVAGLSSAVSGGPPVVASTLISSTTVTGGQSVNFKPVAAYGGAATASSYTTTGTVTVFNISVADPSGNPLPAGLTATTTLYSTTVLDPAKAILGTDGVTRLYNYAEVNITGTAPNAGLANTTYTVTFTDAGGQQGSATFSLLINPGAAPLSNVVDIASRTLTQGTADSFKPVRGVGGDAPLVYTISPTLPSGLSISSSTGIISGTPTVYSAAADYTVTIRDNGGITSVGTFNMTILAPAVIATAVQANVPSITRNVSFTAFKPVNGSGGISTLRYSAASLPTGMSINTSTGYISGPATATTPATSYSIVVTDSNTPTPSSASASVTITVADLLTLNSTLSQSAISLTKNSQNYSFTPVSGSGGYGTLSYAITSTVTLSSIGLSFNTATGQITGNPNALLSSTSFTVTVSDQASQTSSKSFTIEVLPGALSTNLDISNKVVVKNVNYSPFRPVSASGGDGAYTFSVTPDIVTQTGLAFNTGTGYVSGTPTSLIGDTAYTIKVTDQALQESSKIFTLRVEAPPVLVITSIPSKTLVQYDTFTPFIPVTGTGGYGSLTYTISPSASLPTGLNFSASTGEISGIPTKFLVTATTFSVTVNDQALQSNTATFLLTVNTRPLVVKTDTLSKTLIRSVLSTPYKPVSATGGSETYTYAIGSSLPSGVTFNTSTGQVSGTPTVTSTTATYSVTITDTLNVSGTSTFNLNIVDPPPIVTTSLISSSTYYKLVDNINISPVAASGGYGSISFSINPDVTDIGLTFRPNGVLTGIPTQLSNRPYVISATDSIGQTSSTNYFLTITYAPISTTQVVSTSTLIRSKAITPFIPVTSAGGSGGTTFSIDPTLPSGLSFDTFTGRISGTPSSTSTLTTYSITARDSDSNTSTRTTDIIVNDPPPLVTTATTATLTFTVGQTVSGVHPVTASGGDGTISYVIGPTLTAGLTFDGNNGTINGTPVTTSTAILYTVTATDSLLQSSSTGVYITINPQPVSITVNNSTLVFTKYSSQGLPVTPISATGGFGQITYQLSDLLPTGLSFNDTTGEISGTPSVTTATTLYSVLATDSLGQTNTGAFSLRINDVVPDPLVVVAAESLTTLEINQSASFNPVTVTGGVAPYSYVISPTALPTGLIFNADGSISGTPTTTATVQVYTVTVTDHVPQTKSADFSLSVVYTLPSSGKGYTGSRGYTGSTGTQGATGYTGSRSTATGYTGSTGTQGATGFTGSASTVTGYTGSTGTQGITGYTGSTGTQGITGYTGSQGTQGAVSGIWHKTSSSGADGWMITGGSDLNFSSLSNIQLGKNDEFGNDWSIYFGTYLIDIRDTNKIFVQITDLNNPSNFGVYLVGFDSVGWNGTYVYLSDFTVQASGGVFVNGNKYAVSFHADGFVGYTGSTGTQGEVGYTGSTGNAGATGFTGSTGTAGVTGFTGSTGTAGITGFTGSTGTQGFRGYTGSTGTQGIQGIQGYTGSTGTQGDIGYTGSTGTQGDIGYTGSTGTQGEVGYTGSTGTQGDIGYTGSTGTQGEIGFTGSKGDYPFDYQGIWTSSIPNYFPGQVVEYANGWWICNVTSNSTNVPGDGSVDGFENPIWLPFNIGYTGSTGTQGIQGPIGYTGSTGTQGEIGYTGSTGTQGDVGYTGSMGDDGVFVGPNPPPNTEILWLDTVENPVIPMIPIGGNQGQVLMKASVTDYDLIWNDVLTSSTLQSVTDLGAITNNAIIISNTLTSTSSFSNNALYVAGGIGGNSGFNINGDGYLHGNLIVDGYITGTNITLNILSASSATFYGDAIGQGALYAGVLGYTPFSQTIIQAAGDDNNYMEINVQNVNAGPWASTDIVASADNVSETGAFIDMGITSTGWDGTQPGSFADNLGPNDGYLLVGDSELPTAGHLVIGTTSEGTSVKIVVGGTNSNYLTAIFNTATTVSTSTDTGALVIRGGLGIGGAIHALNTSYIAGSKILTEIDLQTITHTATYITNNPGSVTGLTAIAGTSTVYGTYNFGSVGDIWTFNDFNTATNIGFYSINDASGAPAHIVYIGFSSVTEFNRIVLNINYTQNSGHTQEIDLYNYVQSQWDTFTTFSGSTGWFEFILSTIDSTPYISSGTVTLRIYHVSSGNTSHRTWIDYVALEKSIQGGQGPRGATGATGATGAASTATGYTGSTGTAGAIGFTGSTGTQGIQGYTGSTGTAGVIGFTGSTGTQGVIGYTGSTGTVGVTGFTGSTGTVGVTGFTGSTGTQGDIGYTGSTGTVGVTGFTGSTGTQGTVGFTGSTGTAGVTGYTGSTGTVGVTGFTGSTGTQGTVGFTGSTGTQGTVGFTGSTGTVGVTGFTGSTGTQGTVGFTGSTGTAGVTGFTGSTGTQGVIGYTGSAGSGGGGSFTGGTVTNITSFTTITNSTSTITGAVVISGGVGVGKDMYVGGTIIATYSQVQGTALISGQTDTNIPTSVEYLVVAGGGGGGQFNAGGGGAGGLLTGTNFAFSSSTSIIITVGSGGAGGSTGVNPNGAAGSIGNQSNITGATSVTATGGGGGGAYQAAAATSGGSGGGAGAWTTSATGGSGIVGQGHDGGSSSSAATAPPYAGAGGGGAGTVGQSANPGDGGTGVASSISGTSVYYAGGGGGGGNDAFGAGGTGGGGNGSTSAGVSGTANSGGGGGAGGATGSGPGGSGGSGVVIIRYSNSYSAASSTSGSPTYTVSGGYKIYVFTASGTIAWGAANSTSPTTGALVVSGGVGIGGDLYVAGNISAGNFQSPYLTGLFYN